MIVTDELQGQSLEGEQYGRERSGHHDALFVGPCQFEGMCTEFFEHTLRVAGDSQSLNRLVRLSNWRHETSVVSAGTGHQADLLRFRSARSLLGAKQSSLAATAVAGMYRYFVQIAGSGGTSNNWTRIRQRARAFFGAKMCR